MLTPSGAEGSGFRIWRNCDPRSARALRSAWAPPFPRAFPPACPPPASPARIPQRPRCASRKAAFQAASSAHSAPQSRPTAPRSRSPRRKGRPSPRSAGSGGVFSAPSARRRKTRRDGCPAPPAFSVSAAPLCVWRASPQAAPEADRARLALRRVSRIASPNPAPVRAISPIAQAGFAATWGSASAPAFCAAVGAAVSPSPPCVRSDAQAYLQTRRA